MNAQGHPTSGYGVEGRDAGLTSSDPDMALFAGPPPESHTPATPPGLFDAFSWMAGVTVLVVGVLVLLGWAIRLEHLRAALPGVAGMGPATALAFALAGVALLLSRPGPGPGPLRRVAQLLGLVVALIGSARLLGELLAGRIPDWLAPAGRLLRDSWTIEGRMGPNTAANFLLAGGALWLMNGEGRHRQGPAQLAALGSALLSLLALVGQAYRLTEDSGFATLIPMALPASLSFAVLSLGILFSRPKRGVMAILTGTGPGAVLARRLLPFCLLVPITLGWLSLVGERGRYYSVPTALSLLVVANILVFIALIWANAGMIDRMEDQRRLAHEALMESEVFYHSLVETLPQNILRKDVDGRFTFVNRRFCETVGRPFEEIVGRTDYDLFPRPLAEKYRKDDRRVMREGTPVEVVEEHVTPDGQVHYVQVIKTPLRDSEGQVIGIQGIFWDVTERWRYEARLREQNEQLQAMAESERRAHEELKRAQSRMVQTAKLAGLGEMVAGVAHEINNPLSYVSNNVAVLQRDMADIREMIALYRAAEPALEAADPEASARLREFVERADVEYTLGNLDGLLIRTREGLKRIQRIVGDLRTFARLDAGDLADVDLNAGIESTVNIVHGNAKKKHVAVELDLGPLPPVTCFGAKINQVVMNLVSNAIDACDEGGHVRLRTRAEGDEIVVEVADDGCGIPAEIRDRIFDPFFTTKPVGVGTGLGLSISYGIVQDHGGTIEVDSAPGAGARFTIRLPRHAPTRPRPIEPDEPALAEPEPAHPRHERRESPR